MAGDWIKMRVNLHEQPEVIGIARRTGLDADTVVGKLHRVWAWANAVTANGQICHADVTAIDDIARKSGFADAMIHVGWLSVSGDVLTIPHYDRHNGQPAKVRAMSTVRKRVQRSKNDAPVSRKCPTKSGTREEKRRDRKKKHPVSSSWPTEKPPARAPESDAHVLPLAPPEAAPPPKPARAPRPRDELFDAVAEVGAADVKINGPLIGKVVASLKSADPPYTPAEVRALPDALRAHGLDFTLTVTAIPKHIFRVRAPVPKAMPPPNGVPRGGGRPTRADVIAAARVQAAELDARERGKRGPGDVHELG
jgi:hypothetical protein